MTKSAIQLLTGVLTTLNPIRKKELLKLLAVIAVSGFLELGAVVSFLPFLAFISGTHNVSIAEKAYKMIGLDDYLSKLLVTTALACLSTLVSTQTKLYCIKNINSFAARIGSDLSEKAYNNILNQSYEFHIEKNTSNLVNTIVTNVFRTVNAVVASLQILSSGFAAFLLILALLIVSPVITCILVSILGGAYIFIYVVNKRKLLSNGHEVSRLSEYSLKILNEGLGSIRDVIIDSSQRFYTDLYSSTDRLQRQLQAKNSFLSSSPRYILESIAICTLCAATLVIAFSSDNIDKVFPIIGLIAVTAQKLLPALQQIYGSFATVKSYSQDISNVLGLVNLDNNSQRESINSRQKVELDFEKSISLQDIIYSYPGNGGIIISGLNLFINKGQFIGVVGTTGSGKSTFIDILMGLLVPQSGDILVDRKSIYSSDVTLKSWRSKISHVPQDAFLADGTIAGNIAFGVPANEVDYDLIYKAAKAAKIHDYIVSLPRKYESNSGERGVKLSGGQKQRVAIARALYKNREILILDEATSALDVDTESQVMQNIKHMAARSTVFMVAHRLDTLKSCDKVMLLREGKVAAFGDPSHVLNLYLHVSG